MGPVATPVTGRIPARRPIQVFLAEDNFPYRMFLRELIDSQGDMEVVGEAGNGIQAEKNIWKLSPDVVIMDLKVPGASGPDTLQRITDRGVACKVIVLSGNRPEPDPKVVHRRTQVQVLPKAHHNDPNWNATLLSGIRGSTVSPVDSAPKEDKVSGGNGVALQALLLGASTGGPQAMVHVLQGLPERLPFPGLIVIHVADRFSAPLAEWLSEKSGKVVRVARHGELLLAAAGEYRLALDNHHMSVVNNHIELSQGPPMYGLRPAVDVLFASAAKQLGRAAMGVLLTGMGQDGGKGLLQIRRGGGMTIVQDIHTAVASGMPSHATRIGAAIEVLPLDRIAESIEQKVRALRRC